MNFRKALFSATVFFSALLLFLVQPLIAKIILPWFGGAASVWLTCNVFFQLALLAGYGYGHFLSTRLGIRAQAIVHAVLCILVWATLQVYPTPVSLGQVVEAPVGIIFYILMAHVGFPFFILSSTSSIAQSWFRRSGYGEPYPLFAVSNFGSLLALVLYPFVLEPNLSLTFQTRLWSWGYGSFVLLMLVLAMKVPKNVDGVELGKKKEMKAKLPARRLLGWAAFSFLASALFLAFTNHICHDVAIIPLLWIAPLAVYLLSFVICFSGWWKNRSVLWCAIFVVLGILYDSSWLLYLRVDFKIALSLLCLFCGCMYCNGELYRDRPEEDRLTLYYFVISIGGACGGIFVTFIAPHIFRGYWELPWLVGILLLMSYIHILRNSLLKGWYDRRRHVAVTMGILLAGVLVWSFINKNWASQNLLYSNRNFYGTVYVQRDAYCDRLVGGKQGILYGMQIHKQEYRDFPTTYYGEGSGAEFAIKEMQRKKSSIRVAAIGLGVGTVASYGRYSDYFRFYEINPIITQLALKSFSFLNDSRSKIDLVNSDGRLAMESENGRPYDVILIDAFTGDSVPIHLLTKEAFEIYLRHLAPDGVIAIHASNKHIDLLTPIAKQAQHYKIWGRVRENQKEPTMPFYSYSIYALLSWDPIPELETGTTPLPQPSAKDKIWTDDYSSWLPYLKRN